MAISYNWIIESMDTYPEKNGKNKVVHTLNWRVFASDGDIKSTSYGSIGIPFDEDGQFINYENLSLDQVVGWAKNELGNDRVSEIESGLNNKIIELKSPIQTSFPNPWEL